MALLTCAVLAAAPVASAAELRGGEDASFPLRVMTLNILYGGDELDLATGDFCTSARGCPRTLTKVIQTIRASGADIVGLEEAEHNTRKIANALGWFASERLQIVSRYR